MNRNLTAMEQKGPVSYCSEQHHTMLCHSYPTCIPYHLEPSLRCGYLHMRSIRQEHQSSSVMIQGEVHLRPSLICHQHQVIRQRCFQKQRQVHLWKQMRYVGLHTPPQRSSLQNSNSLEDSKISSGDFRHLPLHALTNLCHRYPRRRTLCKPQRPLQLPPDFHGVQGRHCFDYDLLMATSLYVSSFPGSLVDQRMGHVSLLIDGNCEGSIWPALASS